jgi:hypothetical protein
MAWDESKNKVIQTKKIKGPNGEALYLELFSYNKGPQKIGLRHEVEIKGKKELRPLPNFTPEQGLKISIGLKKFCKEILGLTE